MVIRLVLIPWLSSICWLTLLRVTHGRRESAKRHVSISHDLFPRQRRRTTTGACGATTSVLQAEVLIDVVGRPSLVTSSDIAALEAAFMETYNTHSTGTCTDASGFRNATQVTISLQAYSSVEGSFTQSFTLIASVVGSCNGCDPNSTRLFLPYGRRYLREEDEHNSDYQEREVQYSRKTNSGGSSPSGNSGGNGNGASGNSGSNPSGWGPSTSHQSQPSRPSWSNDSPSPRSSPTRAPQPTALEFTPTSGSLQGLTNHITGSIPTSGTNNLPTVSPTSTPSPSTSPTATSTPPPTKSPTTFPTVSPTALPTSSPTTSPTTSPTALPTPSPTTFPTISPTTSPTASPTTSPTSFPTVSPTIFPTAFPTSSPSISSSPLPSTSPSISSSPFPSTSPTVSASPFPSTSPTISSSSFPSASPSISFSANKTSIVDRTVCDCPGVSHRKFGNYFNNAVQNLVSSVDQVDAVYEMQQTCDASIPITSFTTSVAIAFETGDMNANALSNQLSVLEDAFQLTYNDLNAYNSELCDQNFHLINSVVMQTDFSLGRRRLGSNAGGWNGAGPYNGTEYSVFFAIVSGTCRGCTSDANIFAPSPSSVRRNRKLSEGSDQCSCPIGAPAGLPSLDSFVLNFGEVVFSLIESNAITVVDTVADVVPVKPVQCASTQASLNNTIKVELETTADLSADDLKQLEVLFANSYNELTRQTCDPYFTNVVSAQVTTVSTVPAFRKLVATTAWSTLLLKVSGRCRGCPSSTPLMNDAVSSGKSSTTSARFRRRRQAIVSHEQLDQPPSRDPFHNPFRFLQWFDDGPSDDDGGPYRFQGHQQNQNAAFASAIGKAGTGKADVCYCDRDATDNVTPTSTAFATFFNETVLLQNLNSIGQGGVISVSVVST